MIMVLIKLYGNVKIQNLKWEFYKYNNKFTEFIKIYDKPPYLKNIKTVDEKIFILKNYKNFEINYSSYMNKIVFLILQINLKI